MVNLHQLNRQSVTKKVLVNQKNSKMNESIVEGKLISNRRSFKTVKSHSSSHKQTSAYYENDSNGRKMGITRTNSSQHLKLFNGLQFYAYKIPKMAVFSYSCVCSIRLLLVPRCVYHFLIINFQRKSINFQLPFYYLGFAEETLGGNEFFNSIDSDKSTHSFISVVYRH